ncbi:LAO/AO transport system ATPase [Ferroglobus placidus DSM 10642]|uniref:LAO/AO transport system ATPase n=1 Tax=Ferroglobus placidus (strain DSM 10642 / AEDII12DO) TaxID=589924 RepID=D3RZ18_FERPA|nr:methylmalonyl Co-A mutase-associated GTPase MeaB [Ferroglobus placidus]ADC65731.1 LAO/AO transport system ATPase [Ferroglobus placidus DSM 10642]
MNVEEIVEGILNKNRRALARAITYVENEYPEGKEILKRVYHRTGKAHVVGITGFPGVGKSTTVSKLTQEFRRRGKTVGIVAVDPGSPFTGGALLGDRLRLDGLDVNNPLWLDEGVFFRSMSSRGRAGGIAAKTGDVVRLMDAFGFDVIFVETVGAGQSEVDIIEVADTSIVILMPEMGDDIQINKAGILEIGDIYVVNKADLGGAEKTVKWLKSMIMMDQEALEILSKTTHADEHAVESGEIFERLKRTKDWIPPVLTTVAEKGEGIKELADAIEQHFEYLKKSGKLEERRIRRLSREVFDLIMDEIKNLLSKNDVINYREVIQKVVRGELDPHTAAEMVVEKLIRL